MELLTTTEVAAMLRLTVARVSQLCAEGRLKARRTHGDSGHWRIERESLMQSIGASETLPAPEKKQPVLVDTSIFQKIKQQTKGN